MYYRVLCPNLTLLRKRLTWELQDVVGVGVTIGLTDFGHSPVRWGREGIGISPRLPDGRHVVCPTSTLDTI